MDIINPEWNKSIKDDDLGLKLLLIKVGEKIDKKIVLGGCAMGYGAFTDILLPPVIYLASCDAQIPSNPNRMITLSEKRYPLCGLTYSINSENKDRGQYELQDGLVQCFFNDPKLLDVFNKEVILYRERVGFDIRFGTIWISPDSNANRDKYGLFENLVADKLESC